MKRILRTGSLDFKIGIVGELGGVHFHVSHKDRLDCGIEMHRRLPDDPQATTCWLIDSPCEHDGSTLVGREHWLPIFERCNTSGDFEEMYLALEQECRERFTP